MALLNFTTINYSFLMFMQINMQIIVNREAKMDGQQYMAYMQENLDHVITSSITYIHTFCQVLFFI